MSELVIPLHLEPLEEGGYVATSDAIPGLVAQGRTVAETVEIAQDVARKLLESYQAHGDPLPPSLQPVESRGFDLAVPVGLSRQAAMGRLSGFRYRDLVAKLRQAGFEFDRQAKGSHEIWQNPRTRARTTLVNHPGPLPEGTVRAIIRQTGLSIDEFLDL